MVKEETIEKININVEVERDMHTKLRILALEKGVEFHAFLRLIFQDAIYKKDTRSVKK